MKMPKATETATRRFEALVPKVPGVVVRKMFGQPAAFLQGQMFLGVFGDEVFVRLSVADRATAIDEGGHLFEPMPGRPMREYVVLGPKAAASPVRARSWVAKGVAYAQSLPPK